MIYPVFVYYDRVACEHTGPVLEVNELTAIRTFQNKCKANPYIGGDLELYRIGDFDSVKGTFINLNERPEFVCRAPGGEHNE